MNVGPLEIEPRVLYAGMVVGGIMLLAVTEQISGDAALFALLGVGAAVGVYERRKRKTGDGGT